jgi:hypothetical protein
MIPGADGSKFSVTAANVTKLFPVNLKEGELVALSSGSTSSNEVREMGGVSSVRCLRRPCDQSDHGLFRLSRVRA